jgi:hypothetical protein
MEKAMSDNNPEFAQDLLRGADEIAEFLFGDRKLRRRVYHLSTCTNVPLFKLGAWSAAEGPCFSAGYTSRRRGAKTTIASAPRAARLRERRAHEI